MKTEKKKRKRTAKKSKINIFDANGKSSMVIYAKQANLHCLPEAVQMSSTNYLPLCYIETPNLQKRRIRILVVHRTEIKLPFAWISGHSCLYEMNNTARKIVFLASIIY